MESTSQSISPNLSVISSHNDENPSIDSSKIIVINFGSLFLRIGRASDSTPKTLYHVIARRNKSNKVVTTEEPFLVSCHKIDKELNKSFSESQSSVMTTLSSCLTTSGLLRSTTNRDKLIDFNKRSKPVLMPKNSSNIRQWTQTVPKQDFIIGEEVLFLKPTEPFHIRWPIRRGRLNVNNGLGGSLTSVISDLESIWSLAIEKYLEIPLNQLNQYRVILIIPDVYNRNHVKCLIDLLLINLQFEGLIVIHEAVCASFGAGLSYACVVDVGDQKTSICCVEDGFATRNTRLTLDYGGSDITQLFYYLLKQRGFPYSECKAESRIGGMLLQELKEKYCHLNLDIFGAQQKQFQVRIPDQPIVNYTLLVGDECLLAPLALFHPELFALTITNGKKMRILNRNEGLSDDPFDENYLIQTKRKYGETNENSGQTNDLNTSDQGVNDIDDLDACEVTANDKEINTNQQLLGIDQAILLCIDQCDSDEVKRRMYSSILLVGGGLAFAGIEKWLQSRLSLQIPVQYRGQSVDIVVKPKDMDTKIVTWKGAAVMSLLDSAQEMWINSDEWLKFGSRVLREKSSFVF